MEDQVSSEQGFNLAELGRTEKFIDELNRVVLPTEVSLGNDRIFRSRSVSIVGMSPIGLKYIFDAIAGKDVGYYGEHDWRDETYKLLRQLGQEVDTDIDFLLETANVFRKRPSMGNFEKFVRIAPKITLAVAPLTVEDGIIEDRLDPGILVALDTAGHHMSRLQFGEKRIQASAAPVSLEEVRHTLYFARQEQGVRSEISLIHHEDSDARANLVNWKRYARPEELKRDQPGAAMMSSSIYYQGLEDALLVNLDTTETKGGRIASAKMTWVATVVPSGHIYGLEWHKHPTGDPTIHTKGEAFRG